MSQLRADNDCCFDFKFLMCFPKNKIAYILFFLSNFTKIVHVVFDSSK